MCSVNWAGTWPSSEHQLILLIATSQFLSDLNINAFCFNFRVNGKVNEDVEEANFLNNAVYRALSIIDEVVEVTKVPMFLSATTFEMETYGECCTHYKARLGLETQSKQDLFVLRNAVSLF